MQIELEQLMYPACAEDVPCAMCGGEFRLGLVVARVLGHGRMDTGEVCPECVLYLARGPMAQARPDAFPTLEDFVEKLEEWTEPLYASEQEFWKAIDDE